MANLAKKFDSDLQYEVRVVSPEEAGDINASTGFINKESVLNDGQLTDEEKNNLESSACNDNSCENPNGDDDNPSPEPADIALPVPVTEEDEEDMSNISIDIDKVSACTGIAKAEIQAVCVGGNTSVAIPMDLPDLYKFITINEGAAKTAEALT